MAARKAEVIITCDASTVKRVIEGLNREMAKANQRRQELQQKQLAGVRLTKQEEKELQSLVKYENALAEKQEKVNKEMKVFGQVMSDLANSKTKDLKRALREGKQALDSMTGKDPNRQRLINDLQRIQRQIEKNTAGMQSFGKTHSSIWKSAVRNITAYVGVFGTFNFIKTKFTEIIKLNNELSDQMADIRKVSGLTMEDIRNLVTNLTKIDTRTTLTELNQIAYAGAKLGFGEHGIEGLEAFTRAANQVNVALKEDLGEEALTALSKITENMGLIKKMGVEQAMLATSSAMFKLAATSTAAAGPIVEVTKRLAPVAQMSGFATHEILALASASDSLQLMPEVVGTALSKLIMAMQNNHNLIEKYLSIPEGTIASMFKAGKQMEALMLVFDKMKGKNVTQLDGLWKLLGSDGQRLITVVASLANHNDTLAKHLETSTKAFKEATAVTEEYNIQQETAAALIERANNMWRNAFVNPEQSETVKEIAQAWYDFTKSLLESSTTMSGVKFSVDVLVFSLKTLIHLLPGLMIGGLARLFGSLAISIGQSKVATDGLTLSWNKLNTAAKANWISLAIGLLAQFVFWIKEAITATDEAAEAQRRMGDAVNAASEKADQEIAKLDQLRSVLNDANIAQEERTRLLSKLKSEYDIYLDYLGIEIETVDDLAKHYNALTKVMRQRFAYQEREDYKRDVMGGSEGSRMKRRKAGADLLKEAQKAGANFDLEDLDILIRAGESAEAIYERLNPSSHRRGRKGRDQMLINTNPNSSSLWGRARTGFEKAISTYVLARRAETEEEKKIDDAFANEIGNFDYDKWLRSQVKGEFKPATDKEAGKAARAAAAAARKEQAKAKAAMIKQMEQAKKDSTALIDNIEAYYNLQQTAVNESVKDGRRTADEAKALNKELEKKKDEALYQARLALTGEENSFDKMRKEQMGTDIDMLDYSELSQKILAQIVGVNLEEAYKNLSKFDGSEAVYGVNAGAFLNEIRNKATEYQKKRSEIEVKQMEDMQKILESYDLLEKLFGDTAEDFIKLGFPVADLVDAAMSARMRAEKTKRGATGGADVDAKHFLGDAEPLIEGKAEGRVNAFRQMLMQFLESGVEPYIINPKNDQELARWFLDFASNKRQDEAGNPIITKWASQNQEYSEWFGNLTGMRVDENGIFDAEDLEKTIAPIREKMQTFWTTLIGFEDNYYETLKKNYDRDKKLFEERWERSGEGQAFSDADKELDLMQRRKELSGAEKGTNFAQQAGFTTLSTDPEIAASMLRMEQARRELELVKQVSEDKRLIREKEQELTEAQMKLEEEVMSKINERITKLQEWTAPIEQFGESVGEAMGTALRDGESMSEGIKNALRSMVEAYGKSTIKIVTELMMQRLRKKMIYRAMEADAKKEQKEETNIEQEGGESRLEARSVVETGIAAITQKATNEILATKKQSDQAEMQQEGAKAKGKVTAGIAEGAADIIGKLGWWGIPLIAVITALLNGLLSMALNALFGSGSSSESTTNNSTKTNTKLVSSMLTYDSGNVQSVLGTDGRFYRATSAPTLPDGVSIVSQPIATTVNGQQALVGEQGPEIVIGRRTSRNIMMNEPALLHHLLQLDRNRTVAGSRQVFDSGNLTTVAAANVPTDGNPLLDSDTLAALRALPVVMAALNEQLKKPVHINMFGRDGIYEKSRQAARFMKQYE